MYKIYISFLLLLILPFIGFAQQKTIRGTVVDKSTRAPLSFASIAIPNTSSGTMTNENGAFEIQLKGDQNSIQVSFMGYLDTLITITNKTKDLKIALQPYEYVLTEVVVRSLTPLEYIQKALEKYPTLITNEPFEMRSFFAEKSSIVNDENDAYKLNEAVFTSYYGNYQVDSVASENQLFLFRNKEEGVYSSMLEKNKKLNRQAERRKKKNEDKEDEKEKEEQPVDTGNNVSIDGMTGEGPGEVLKEAQRLTTLDFFKSKYFKKIKFTFGKQTHYLGRDLITINFSNKRKIENSYYNGSIYLDYEDLAIVAVKYNERGKIPGWVNLLIKGIAGFSIAGIQRDVSIRNQYYAGKWYPKEIVVDLELKLKQKGEIEAISMAQLLNIDEINAENPKQIDPSMLFDPEEDFEPQIRNTKGLHWDDVNVIQF